MPAAAAFCTRWLLIGVAVYALVRLAVRLQVVVIPVVVAVLLAALLAPLVTWLDNRGFPRWLATITVMLTGLAVLSGVLVFVVASFAASLPALSEQLVASVRSLHDWAVYGPLGLDPQQIGRMQQQVIGWLSSNQQRLASGALSTTFTVGGILGGMLLVLFSLVFFLHGGNRIWQSMCRIAPARQRERIELAGRRAFRSLTAYARATSLVAMADAIGIGAGLWIVGVPLAGPLTALVFLGGFLPVLGALVSGAIAVLVTLVTQGFLAALIILVVVVIVQQIEGNVLQPWLLGDAAQLHPLAVVLTVTAGASLAGVIGALLAVPLVTTVQSFVQTWTHDSREQEATAHQS
ncbi:putative PurR-regulated permease PerM [Saccharopolyspora lacisalsi]|uniref:Putative PurR-regulated permease PerM n=1 Tax=Halosaccharopolyspora lacisalsi TaxID=1000566 RepID=A0A839E0B0_9PSEU|nr:putative PurR-regulated permease PerM [Halosaccharopolyspora lacisalsi]